MTIIYDFDGTLTPYSFPQYEIIKKCGFTKKELLAILKSVNNEDVITAFINAVAEKISEKNLELTPEMLYDGADKTVFNDGVISFFENLNNVSHIVITSGFKEYVKGTKINKYLKEIYGTTVTFSKNGEFILEEKVTEKRKAEIIKNMVENEDVDRIIYIGDGYTDKFAFEYVHSIGGISIFVSNDIEENKTYKSLLELDIIDKCFTNDFTLSGDLYKYIKQLLD